ncbi:molybdopterin molybdotransferase MoeA [Nesterenkonia sp. CL21]|uniref:molybdopterin molybdotransferase MoeA n=1 Tax=Nesterenkonia sp. CL21 TaxID=3064894 RepID=UPI0028782603|nr:gephyrin-like molybdotransferase Glp [Nesterenkonia sp. CL21]MDS2171369.1 molybdopterin molybdotransferase MoeA [Nesterenkonia sp. CL21]
MAPAPASSSPSPSSPRPSSRPTTGSATTRERASVSEHVGRLRTVLSAALQDPARHGGESLRVTEPGLVGRVAAADVIAEAPLPGFDNSQMDGFAVRSADLTPGEERSLPLAGVVPAGSAAPSLPEGATAAVMTGAPLPEGADVVIPVELTTAGNFQDLLPQSDPGASGPPSGWTARSVTFTELTAEDLSPGRFIRPAGSDVEAGETVLRAGEVLTPARLGLLAALGRATVSVRPRTRALVLSTGDEVRRPGSTLRPGQLHDANTPLLMAGLESLGVEAHAASAASDDVATFTDVVEELISQYDPQLLVTAGGISAGAFEVVRQSLADRGIEFGSIRQQPGGPQGWGLIPADGRRPAVAVVCLPGNPVSCAVSLETLLRPALASLDVSCPPPHRIAVTLAEAVESRPGVTQYRRAEFCPASTDDAAQPPTVRLVGGPSSHLLGHLARADVLVELTEDDTHVPAGAERHALLLTGRRLP